MAEPDWSRVLDVLYRKGDTLRKPKNRITKHHPLCTQTELSEKRVLESLEFLRNNGMISIKDADHKEMDLGHATNPRSEIIKLDPKGFEVAHDRELSKRQEGATTATAYLTGVLAVTAVVQAAAAASNASPTDSLLLYLMAGGAGIVLLASWWQLYRIGLIDIEKFE